MPAGERLVAGFKRVDFDTALRPAEDFAPARDEERDESLLTVLATGLLILGSHLLRPNNAARNPAKLSIAFGLIQ